MAIWSLTQERIDKLMQQIGDKEAEMDRLIKTSEKELWTADLDAFLNEWETCLADEAKRAKEISRMGRRESKKLRIGGKGGKKRKANDSDSDEDFAYSAPKAAKTMKSKAADIFSNLSTGTAAAKKAAAKPGGLLSSTIEQKLVEQPPAVQQGLIKEDIGSDMDVDIKASEAAAKPQPRARKIVTSVSDDEDEDDAFLAVGFAQKQKEIEERLKAKKNEAAGGRQARAAAKKPVKYAGSSDFESSDADMGFDVGNMVKTFGNAADGPSKSLFLNTASASRPSSSHSVTKPRQSRAFGGSDDEPDATDYQSLIPRGSPAKPAARSAREYIGSDDDDDLLEIPKPKTVLKKTVTSKPQVKPVAKAKKVDLPVEKKPLSPAAKAYAAKQARIAAAASKPAGTMTQTKLATVTKRPAAKKKQQDSDSEDDDKLVNDILTDDDDKEPAPAMERPSRRAAAAKATKYVVDLDDEEEDESSEAQSDDFEEDDSD